MKTSESNLKENLVSKTNIPITIISRTQRFDFRRISCPDIVSKLSKN